MKQAFKQKYELVYLVSIFFTQTGDKLEHFNSTKQLSRAYKNELA